MIRTILSFILLSSSLATISAQTTPLQQILRNLQADSILSQPERYRVQILYTQIDRDRQNHPHFTSYYFGDSTQYFYPASTVKMPAAFLALQKLRELNIVGLDKNSIMRTGAGRPPQTAVDADTSAANGLPSIAHYINKIFIVSDNDAFNRLYEFLGQEYFNEQLREKGFPRTRLIHRLSVSGFDTTGNRYTNPVMLLDSAGKMLYYQGEVFSSASRADMGLGNQKLGKGYLNGQGSLVADPLDFTYRNYIGLRELHDMLKAVMFPESLPAGKRFKLSEDDYRFLYRSLSILPRESASPRYDPVAYYDSYVKFFMFGDDKAPMPDHIRIFNKVGEAYGFLTDVAYVADFKNQVEFLLAATICVNRDEVFNDNVYEYDSVGFPFLAKLGKAVYEYELKRPVRRKPDLSRFKVKY